MPENDTVHQLLSSTFAPIGLTEKQLDELQRRGPIQRLLGVVALLAAAGLSIFIGPTVAIVFATLAIAAVWLLPLPPVRRAYWPDGPLVLRDQAGTIRLAAVLDAEGAPGILFRDREGKQRMALGLGGDGSPQVGLFDEHQRPRLQFGATQEGSALMVSDAQGGEPVSITVHDGRAALVFEDVNGGSKRTFITNGGAEFTNLDRHVYVDVVAGDGAKVICKYGDDEVSCGLDERRRGILVRSGEALVIAGITDDTVRLSTVRGSAVADVAIEGEEPHVAVRTIDVQAGTVGKQATLAASGTRAEMSLQSGNHLLVAVTPGDATGRIIVKDGDAPARSLVSPPSQQT